AATSHRIFNQRSPCVKNSPRLAYGDAAVYCARRYLKPPALSLCSQRKIRPSITRRIARAFARARFAFSVQRGTSSESFRSTTRIESCNAVIETEEHKGDFKEP